MHTLIISSRYNKMFCLNRHTYSLNIFFSLDHVSRYVYKVQINVLHIVRDWRVILFNLLRILVHIFTGFYKIYQLSFIRPYSTAHILVMLYSCTESACLDWLRCNRCVKWSAVHIRVVRL